MKGAFPSGNFLFHAALAHNLVSILESGVIKNARALGVEHSPWVSNGGDVGVSWSLNQIEAIPGSRFHMAGFVGAPETVLDHTHTQLAIPDESAPYEAVQISDKIDAGDLYEKYIQHRILKQAEKGIMDWKDTPTVVRSMIPFQEVPKELYETDEHGEKRLKREFLEYTHVNHAISGADVWLQLQGETSRSNKALDNAIRTLRSQRNDLRAEIAKSVTEENDVAVPVDKLYFVAARKDIERWLKVLVRCNTWPAGIIVYDSTDVRLEDFLSAHIGDGEALTKELRKVIDEPTDGSLYNKMIGRPFGVDMRDKADMHFVADHHLGNTKRVVMRDGELVVE